jgi:hypothetical protein
LVFSEALAQPPAHSIVFVGDPTVEFSLMAFLNRFAYKNPKKSVAENSITLCKISET